ncbi:MAG: FAD-dependent oxidoreductase [Pseudonocardiaceae bacterium]|nr:FAD-dependent oxidoreductase [Pseudonocardiaceae bacterium]
MPAQPESSDVPVIVVGGGPVGMVAAAALARHGIRVVLVESEPVPQTDWRASTFHPATLELLDGLGVVEQMHAEGLTVPVYQFRDRTEGLVAEFDFGLLAAETPYPYRLQLNQQHLVRMLHERLAATPGVELRFGTSVTAIAAEAGGAWVQLQGQAGSGQLRAGFVIGADGATSSVRRLLDIGFDGFTYPEQFLIASTSVDMREVLPGLADVNYIADPVQWLFLLRTREAWRAVWPVPADRPDSEATDPATLQAQLQGIAQYPPGYPITDHQIYRVHQRIASTFRLGRAVLVGDAAHINSPIGGVGLNSGIHDALDVTARLARILREGAPVDPELDEFADVRRRVALEYVQADTQRNTERLREADEERRQRNRAQLREIAADPERARAWVRRVSLLESVQRFGVGRRPERANTATSTGSHR